MSASVRWDLSPGGLPRLNLTTRMTKLTKQDEPGNNKSFSVLVLRWHSHSGGLSHHAFKESPVNQALLPAFEPLRILVVDDNSDAAESLAEVLNLGGEDVHV